MLNHAQIADIYTFPADAHRTLQRDVIARFDQVERASGLAAEMRASTRKPITYTRSTRLFCVRCGSRNTVKIGRFADCHSCGHSWARF